MRSGNRFRVLPLVRLAFLSRDFPKSIGNGESMGGFGSGRWGWHSKKTTVEECRQLDVSRLYHEGVLAWGRRWVGAWQWTEARTGEKVSNIGLEADTTDRSHPFLRVFYTFTAGRNKGQSADYKIRLQTTALYFGGCRWWLTCPLVASGQPCGRRVGKLYLPAGALYFGCRHCYDLTYRSAQEHDPPGVGPDPAADD